MIESIKNNEFVSSINKTINDRFGNIMYGTFVVSWCVWNWESIYITFFVDQDIILQLYGQLKISYLQSQYSFSSLSISIWSIVRLIIGPALSTYIIIWWLSKIDFLCNKKYFSSNFAKEKELTRQQKQILIDEKSVLIKKEENIKLKKDIRKELSNEERWEIEESEFHKNKLYGEAMQSLETCLYSHHGQLTVFNEYTSTPIFDIPSNQLAFLDVNKLISFNDPKSYISATEKGKYFLKKFIDNRDLFKSRT